MVDYFFRQSDTDNAIIMDVYGETQRLIDFLNIDEFKMPLYDWFISSLLENENGKIQCHFESHQLTLQHSSHPSYHNADKLATILDHFDKIKGRLIENFVGNVAEQSQTFFIWTINFKEGGSRVCEETVHYLW